MVFPYWLIPCNLLSIERGQESIMKVKIRNFVELLLKEEVDKLFSSNPLIKRINFEISKIEGEVWIRNSSINLVIEDRTKCPDNQTAIVEVEKDIFWPGTRSTFEVEFAENIRMCADILFECFGSCIISKDRNQTLDIKETL